MEKFVFAANTNIEARRLANCLNQSDKEARGGVSAEEAQAINEISKLAKLEYISPLPTATLPCVSSHPRKG